MMKLSFGIASALMVTAITFAGCAPESADDGTGSADSVNTAIIATAMEVNEDGSDPLSGGAVEESPVLLRGCQLGFIHAHVVGNFDRNRDGQIGDEERPGLEGEFGPPPGARGHGTMGCEAGSGAHDGMGGPRGDEGGRHLPPHARDRAHRVGHLMTIYDVDQSGDLSDEERAALEADLAARCERRMTLLLAEFDEDGNGELDEDEWKAAHEAIRARFEQRRAAVLAAFDADGNGELDESERDAAHAARRAEREARLAAFDADGDGALNDEERAALLEFMRAEVRGEHWETAADSAETHG